jgi:hypothetical protein
MLETRTADNDIDRTVIKREVIRIVKNDIHTFSRNEINPNIAHRLRTDVF